MNKISSIITDLRKEKKWSQSDLAEKSGVSREMISKYERRLAIPSIEAAKKIADALEVSLDFLVGEGQNASFDKKTLQRLEEVEALPPQEKARVFHYIDLIVRDFKTAKAYMP